MICELRRGILDGVKFSTPDKIELGSERIIGMDKMLAEDCVFWWPTESKKPDWFASYTCIQRGSTSDVEAVLIPTAYVQ